LIFDVRSLLSFHHIEQVEFDDFRIIDAFQVLEFYLFAEIINLLSDLTLLNAENLFGIRDLSEQLFRIEEALFQMLEIILNGLFQL